MVEYNSKKLACFILLFLPLMTHATLYYEEEEPDLLKALESKRAGFIGMRGKKEDLLFGSSMNDQEYVGGDMEAKRGEFVGMRGKKLHMGGEENVVYGHPQFLNLPHYHIASSYKKRRPEFLGMRGKKSGFVGMRGKKKVPSPDEEEAQELEHWSDFLGNNRISTRNLRSFVGMRG